MFSPVFLQQSVEVQIRPVAMVIPGLAPLDALEPHSQFLHQADRLYGINGFRENLVGFAFAEGIVNQGATGFKGIALPPEATVKNLAYFIDVLFVLVEQDIAYHFIGVSANRCYSAFSGNAEGRKEARTDRDGRDSKHPGQHQPGAGSAVHHPALQLPVPD